MPDDKDSKIETPAKEEEKSPKPHANDVLCGRGGSINNHIGNENYRIIVNRKKRVYLTARFKREKRLIAASIVQEVRSLDPPGRFLARDSRNGTWYDIGDLKARDKTSQALREGAPEIRKEMEDDRKKLMEKYRNSIKENKEKAMEVDEEESNSSSEKSVHDEFEVVQSSPIKKPSAELHHSSEESSKHESMRTAVASMKIRDEASWNHQPQQHKHPQHSAFNSYPKPPEFPPNKEPYANYPHQSHSMNSYHARHPPVPQYNSYDNNSTQINNQKPFVEVKSDKTASDIEMEQIQEIWYPSNSTHQYPQRRSSSNRNIPYQPNSLKSASSDNPYSPIQSFQSIESTSFTHRDVPSHHQNGHHHDQAKHSTGQSNDSMPPPNPRVIYHHNLNANASRDSSMLDGLASFEDHLKPAQGSSHPRHTYSDNMQQNDPYYDKHSAAGAYSYSQSIPSPKFHSGRRRQDENPGNQDRQRLQENEEQIQLYAWSTTGRLDLPRLDEEDRDRKRSRHLHRNRTKVHLGHLGRTNEARHTRPPSPPNEYGNNIYVDGTANGNMNHGFSNTTRDHHDSRVRNEINIFFVMNHEFSELSFC